VRFPLFFPKQSYFRAFLPFRKAKNKLETVKNAKNMKKMIPLRAFLEPTHFPFYLSLLTWAQRKGLPWHFLLFFLTLLQFEAQATHIRAGDLTAERISEGGLTYRFTATIYRDVGGVDADPEIEFKFGDLATQMVPLASRQNIGNATERLTYITTFSFPGAGQYDVGVFIRNRNENVRNIPNSVNVPFYIESTFLINPFLGLNRSPILLVPPVDLATKDQLYIHNPGAYDPDGDSLAFRFVLPKRNKNQPVDGFRPLDDPIFGGASVEGGAVKATLNAFNGDLIWDTPAQTGQYNVAFIVEEWRDGILIGQINRDMQIIVRDNPNKPPKLQIPRDTCVVAETFLEDRIIGTDPDGDRISLTAYSALFKEANLISVPPRNYAEFEILGLQPPNGREEADFRWQTVCEDVRLQPYFVTFKVEDNPPRAVDRLADLRTWGITVVGPAPDTLYGDLDIVNSAIRLFWFNYQCPNASQMTVWRREGSFDFVPDNCETGLPAYTGYRQIGAVDINQTTYYDNNGGRGLEKGKTYCYRIFAIFPLPGGGESYVSEEFCITIPTNAPYLTNVSIENTDTAEGAIFVRWVTPRDIDTTVFKRPYTYTLSRAEGFSGGQNWAAIGGVFAENDTTFTDTNLNTTEKVYHYRVTLFAEGAVVDSSASASSVRLSLDATESTLNLTWQAEVPWTNSISRFPFHYIYRAERDGAGNLSPLVLYDSVDVSRSGFLYRDEGREGSPLLPKTDYCYYVMTQGSYDRPDIFEPLQNKSQFICGQLLDLEPPCHPSAFTALEVLDCSTIDFTDSRFCNDSLYQNRLTWQAFSDPTCDPDIVGYRLYFARYQTDSLSLLLQTPDTFAIHEQVRSLAGCYAVSAVDAAGNESPLSNRVCLDNCPNYALPNVFTPNGDGINDTFRPFDCPAFVRQVVFVVYNRWGRKVYESQDDIFLNWDGKALNGKPLPDGLYYYEAKISFNRLAPEAEVLTQKGWVQILSQQGEEGF
jgi:gliding motility-associated-like protein